MSVFNENYQKLSLDILPDHYEISIEPDLIYFTFHGREKIHITIKISTNIVVLNQYELDITRLSFRGDDGKDVAIENFESDEIEEKLTIKFREKLPAGKIGCLNLEFTGKLRDNMKGFFFYPYTSDTGEYIKYAAATQFKPTYARRCFPCWDEPIFKSTFDITLKVPTGLTALSNMPVETEITGRHHTTFVFKKSPKMSTYLVAFVVGEFDYLEDQILDGIKIRIYTPKGKKDHGKFALREATKSLPYYNDYFGIPYPLPKLDCVALPDLITSSTGNWGLVTFRSSCLLIDPESTSSRFEQSKRLLISHRLSQQWFGNLVTMKWWNDLCLYKGVASFTEYVCLDRMYPEHNTWQQFMAEEFEKAIDFDALKNRTPIEADIVNPQEIDFIFDEVSYSKATSVIRMLDLWIGDEHFRKGMNCFLKKYAHDNATIEDFWECLENVSGKPISKVMSTWINQTGYPILRVQHKQQGQDRILTFSQQHFIEDGTSDEEIWMIPVNIMTSSDPEGVALTKLIADRKTEVIVTNVPENSWIKINPRTIGLYRTLYCPDMLNALIPAIKDRTLSPLDRFGLLDDLFYSSKAGHVSLGQVLTLLQAYKQEDTYIVWEIIAKCLSQITALICHLPIYEKFQEFCRNMYRNIYRKVHWEAKEGECPLDTLLRSLITEKMVMLQDKETLADAKKFFELDLEGKCTLPDHMKTRVYLAVINNGKTETLDKMLELYNRTELYEDKRKILSTLGVVNDGKLLKRVLELSISEDMGEQDTLRVFSVYSSSNHFAAMWSREMAYQFIKDYWSSFICHIYDEECMYTMLKWVTEDFVTEEMARDTDYFFAQYVSPVYDIPGHECVHQIRSNVAWLERDGESIKEFLKTVDNK